MAIGEYQFKWDTDSNQKQLLMPPLRFILPKEIRGRTFGKYFGQYQDSSEAKTQHSSLSLNTRKDTVSVLAPYCLWSCSLCAGSSV